MNPGVSRPSTSVFAVKVEFYGMIKSEDTVHGDCQVTFREAAWKTITHIEMRLHEFVGCDVPLSVQIGLQHVLIYCLKDNIKQQLCTV